MRRAALLLVFALVCQARDLTRYAIVLNDAPAGRAGNRAAILAAHLPIRNAVQARGAHIVAESHTLLNAIFVDADGVSPADLETIPGVRYVARMPPLRPTLDRAVELLNVPAAWGFFGGSTSAGTGIKIAVIDSGIEVTHPAFQDPTLSAPANYPSCSIAKLPLVPVDCKQFTSGKVIVARSYIPYVAAGTGSVPAQNSRPDDYSPRDRSGHGTAVAMAAAGMRNSGPSASITGVAPKAWLGSYKVLGTPGVNDSTSADAVIAALEDAFSDGMDVAILSLGAPAFSGPEDSGAICGYAAGKPCDPFAAAVKNAVTGGMVVVVAAGNEGLGGASSQPTWGSISSPAHSPAALAVGAITNSHNWSNGLSVPSLGSFHALLGAGPTPTTASFPLGDAGAVGSSEACDPLPAGSLTGTYALVDRGTCTFAVKVQNLAAAGAAGAIIINVAGDNSVLVPGSLSGTTIPATFIGSDDGQSIRSWLVSQPDAKASMSASLQPFDVSTGNRMADFSSRGPVLGSGGLKPDVTAPGTDLYGAAQTYDPNGSLFSPSGYLVEQGTSFAAPLVAGIAALVKQANPALNAAQIKSAIVNTATGDVTESNGTFALLLAAGTGRANAANAIAANLAAVPSSVSFGILGPAANLPLGQAVQLTNTSKNTLNLTLSIQPNQPDSRAKVTLDRTALVLAAGQTVGVNLSLTGNVPAPGVYEGIITVLGASTPFRIPYLYLSSDGIPWNMIPLVGDGDDGTVGKTSSSGVVIAEVTDRYGIPVSNAPMRFLAVAGGGALRNVDTFTDIYGFAGADITLGPDPGVNTFIASSAGLSAAFSITARRAPAITPNGVVDAGSFTPRGPVAPGSYVAIFGTDLSPTPQIASTPALPVSMASASVSFDSGSLSFPGRLHFVTPGQVNVQVPWEMPSNGSVALKVSVGSSSSELYTLPLTAYAPAMFEYPSGGTSFVAARDENFALIGPANPAKQGRNIQIYCNGLGPVTNQPATGEPSPSVPLASTTTPPTVNIGGQNATVLFSGLTPTVVGLYQINLTVPNVGAGSKPITVTIGGVTSKTSNISIQ